MPYALADWIKQNATYAYDKNTHRCEIKFNIKRKVKINSSYYEKIDSVTIDPMNGKVELYTGITGERFTVSAEFLANVILVDYDKSNKMVIIKS